MKCKLMIAAIVITIASAAVQASTPQAWAALNQQVNRACLAASGLTRAKILADKATFADQVPIELRIVEGYNRQSLVDAKLCAYDRRTRRTEIVDGVGRLGVYRN